MNSSSLLAVRKNVKRFAVERGPLVHCAEGADNGGGVLVKVPGQAVRFETVERPDLFGGTVMIQVQPQAKGDALTSSFSAGLLEWGILQP